jgi:hypothetical protein
MLIDKPSGALRFATASSSSGEGASHFQLKHPNIHFSLRTLIAYSEALKGASSAYRNKKRPTKNAFECT